MRVCYPLLVLFILIPTAWALIVPHSTTYELDWLERKDVCLTVYADEKKELNVTCDDGYFARQPVPARVPVTLCFTVIGDRSKLCTFNLGGEKTYVYIRVVPRTVLSAILAVLLVVLIVRFASKLTRIYTKSM